MNWLDDIDERATIIKAKKLLNQYTKYSWMNFESLHGQRYDTTKVTTSRDADTPLDRFLMKKDELYSQMVAINEAVKQIDDDQARLIKMKYLERNKQPDYVIYNSMNVSERTYYRQINKALFSLALEYKGVPSLVVFKGGD